jgi:peptide deformylase
VPETVLINPTLRPLSEEMEEGFEGCLSVPGLRGSVPRYIKMHYEGFDQHGNPISRSAGDFHARVVQHEVDHLLGILYPMRIKDFSRFGYTDVMFPGLDAGADD